MGAGVEPDLAAAEDLDVDIQEETQPRAGDAVSLDSSINSRTRWPTSAFDCRNNTISNAVKRRGPEEVIPFRICKALVAEAKALTPPVFEFDSMFFTKLLQNLLCRG